MLRIEPEGHRFRIVGHPDYNPIFYVRAEAEACLRRLSADAIGVQRAIDDPQTVLVYFEFPPTDQQINRLKEPYSATRTGRLALLVRCGHVPTDNEMTKIRRMFSLHKP